VSENSFFPVRISGKNFAWSSREKTQVCRRKKSQKTQKDWGHAAALWLSLLRLSVKTVFLSFAFSVPFRGNKFRDCSQRCFCTNWNPFAASLRLLQPLAAGTDAG
jgi:hypothetical protein